MPTITVDFNRTPPSITPSTLNLNHATSFMIQVTLPSSGTWNTPNFTCTPGITQNSNNNAYAFAVGSTFTKGEVTVTIRGSGDGYQERTASGTIEVSNPPKED